MTHLCKNATHNKDSGKRNFATILCGDVCKFFLPLGNMSGPESPAGFGWLYTCICTDPTNYTSTEHALAECADSCAGIRLESCEDALSSQAMVCSEVQCGANYTTDCLITPFPKRPFNWIALLAILLQLLALCLLCFSQRIREHELEEELTEELIENVKAVKTNYKGRLPIRRRPRVVNRTRRSRVDPNPLSDSNSSIRAKKSLDAANQDGRWWWFRYMRTAWSTSAVAASAASSVDNVATQSYPVPSNQNSSPRAPKTVVASKPPRRQSTAREGSSSRREVQGPLTSSLKSKQLRPSSADRRSNTEAPNRSRTQMVASTVKRTVDAAELIQRNIVYDAPSLAHNQIDEIVRRSAQAQDRNPQKSDKAGASKSAQSDTRMVPSTQRHTNATETIKRGIVYDAVPLARESVDSTLYLGKRLTSG